MPEDLISKFKLQNIALPDDITAEEKEYYSKVETYNYPMPLLKVNCWFAIFPGTKFINPNMLIFCTEEGAVSTTLQKMYDLDVPAFNEHLRDLIAEAKAAYEFKVKYN